MSFESQELYLYSYPEPYGDGLHDLWDCHSHRNCLTLKPGTPSSKSEWGRNLESKERGKRRGKKTEAETKSFR